MLYLINLLDSRNIIFTKVDTLNYGRVCAQGKPAKIRKLPGGRDAILAKVHTTICYTASCIGTG